MAYKGYRQMTVDRGKLRSSVRRRRSTVTAISGSTDGSIGDRTVARGIGQIASQFDHGYLL